MYKPGSPLLSLPVGFERLGTALYMTFVDFFLENALALHLVGEVMVFVCDVQFLWSSAGCS